MRTQHIRKLARNISQEDYIQKLKNDKEALQNYLFSKPEPKALEAEKLVIGACLISAEIAVPIVLRFLKPEDLYDTKYNTILKAIIQLKGKNEKIDLVTVVEEIKKLGLFGERLSPPENLKGLKKTRFIKYAVTAFEVVEPSTTIGSAANVETYCKIVKEQSIRRDLIKTALRLVKEAHDPTKDVFELCGETQKQIRQNSPNSILKIQTMNDSMDRGALIAPARRIFGTLIKENEVGFLFSGPGTGKSVLSVQIADAASKGIDVFPDINDPFLQNECEPKKTIFFDFELEDSELFARYSAEGQKKKFNNNFHRVSINDEFLNFDDADELIMSEITTAIEVIKPQFVVVDNITYITSESQDPKIATQVMKRLLGVQKSNPGMTILVIAHTPKMDMSSPIEDRHLSGAKNLSNFAKSIVAIGASAQDRASVRYIKHIKCRNGVMVHDEENVIECVLSKNGVDLVYEYRGHGKETEHLIVTDTKEIYSDIMYFIKNKRKNNDGWRTCATDVKNEFGVGWSYSTLKRRYLVWKDEKDGSTVFEEKK